jgi:hypothetical protein
MMAHLPVAEKHLIERGMAHAEYARSPSSRSAVVPVRASSLQNTLSKGAGAAAPSARACAARRQGRWGVAAV